MQAVILEAPRRLRIGSIAPPPRSKDAVLVRVTHTGVCGTDVKIWSGAIRVRYPRVMGHEIVGEVVEVDANESLAPGTRVVIDPELYCGRCYHCRIGQTHLCPDGRLLGRDEDGGFAEYVVVPRSHVYPLPSSVDSLAAPLIQVLTTCLHAQRQVPILPADTVAVLGLGVTGQLHVQLAKARGASPVIGITRSAAKRDLARTLGADLTLASGEGAVAAVREATEGRGADVVIETTGALTSVAAAIEMVRAGGRIVLFGIITAKEGPLPFYDLYFKELTLVATRVARGEDFPHAIALVERGLVRLDPLVSEVHPLSALDAALEQVETAAGNRLKIILDHRAST